MQTLLLGTNRAFDVPVLPARSAWRSACPAPRVAVLPPDPWAVRLVRLRIGGLLPDQLAPGHAAFAGPVGPLDNTLAVAPDWDGWELAKRNVNGAPTEMKP